MNDILRYIFDLIGWGIVLIPQLLHSQGKHDYVWISGYNYNPSTSFESGLRFDFITKIEQKRIANRFINRLSLPMQTAR